ncbi:pyruvate kinase [Desulfosudis oleivorans]|uniref:Pyruvate kinase n=1 Tax=Desulfosudis oleivorans (strain DSM 6200 / JCM 39069 / Hxd3) TaxID=96561 RepID=A8ZTZ6_DESOH|nr:pyruvate kinase [Desulfosudis oleivorans]ABW67929.1 pyruvate kinase [Desulfosudis oleivorans Hxd3]
MQTKLIATIGPRSRDRAVIEKLVAVGVTIFRLNFSHAGPGDFADVIQSVREIEQQTGTILTLMGDLSGPKIRIGEVAGAPLSVATGQLVRLGPARAKGAFGDALYLPLELAEILEQLKPGAPVILSDGIPVFRVRKRLDTEAGPVFELETQNSGLVSSNKGISFPGLAIDLPALTAKDRSDVAAALDVGIDALALSFVQKSQDVVDLKKEMEHHGRQVPVIVKIERMNAIDHFQEIVAEADVIMVARGDLGLECSLPALPVIQKRIIDMCAEHQKPVVVATQMLLSMVHNPLPTRAEVADVANAIMDGADAVMLSEETAVGEYPVEAAGMLAQVAEHTERFMAEKMGGPRRPRGKEQVGKHLAYSACLVADHAGSRALACHTVSGHTAATLSACRPARTVYALSPHLEALRYANFLWGVKPVHVDDRIADHLDRVEHFISTSGAFVPGESIVITSGQPTPGQRHNDTNQIKIYYKGNT